MPRPPESIICVECGGTAHLISYLPEEEDEELEPDFPLAYRCSDCMERMDITGD